MSTTDLQGEVNVRNFELSVGERSAEIAGLLIGGRPVSEVDFRSIPCERLEGLLSDGSTSHPIREATNPGCSCT